MALLEHKELGIYIHWPFCLSKCPYCDFNTYVRADIDQERWAVAYLKSLRQYAEKTNDYTVISIYFGGGTPSLMKPQTVARIIDEVNKRWTVMDDVEITLEANPTSVEMAKLKAFMEAGVNRISLGVQALNDPDLKFLGREHSADQAISAISLTQDLFDRMSFDLIYARPDQSLQDWEAELNRAASLAKGHLSLYQLTIERNTPFYYDHEQGKFCVPKEDVAADFYNLTQDILGEHNLPAYEVSNHAAPDQESRHNLIYWRYQDYIGIGPGAHGRLTLDGEKYATREHHAADIWLEGVERKGFGAHPYQKLSGYDRYVEALMMGLRLREGISFNSLAAQGEREWDAYLDHDKLETCISQGWASKTNRCLCLSQEGRLRLNVLMSYLIKDSPLSAVKT